MTSTQLPNLRRGFPPDIRKPVQNSEPCRKDHELVCPNLRDPDFIISPSIMVSPIFSAPLWQSWTIFSIIFYAWEGAVFPPKARLAEPIGSPGES
jgi:hypothetical protein